MIEVKFPNGSVIVTDAPRSAFVGMNCVITDSDYIGKLDYSYLNKKRKL